MSNEKKACDAIIRFLEERARKVRANVRRSEVTNGLPPVELDFDIGDQHFAVEHTLLQTFAQQIWSAKQFWVFRYARGGPHPMMMSTTSTL